MIYKNDLTELQQNQLVSYLNSVVSDNRIVKIKGPTASGKTLLIKQWILKYDPINEYRRVALFTDTDEYDEIPGITRINKYYERIDRDYDLILIDDYYSEKIPFRDIASKIVTVYEGPITLNGTTVIDFNILFSEMTNGEHYFDSNSETIFGNDGKDYIAEKYNLYGVEWIENKKYSITERTNNFKRLIFTAIAMLIFVTLMIFVIKFAYTGIYDRINSMTNEIVQTSN